MTNASTKADQQEYIAPAGERAGRDAGVGGEAAVRDVRAERHNALDVDRPELHLPARGLVLEEGVAPGLEPWTVESFRFRLVFFFNGKSLHVLKYTKWRLNDSTTHGFPGRRAGQHERPGDELPATAHHRVVLGRDVEAKATAVPGPAGAHPVDQRVHTKIVQGWPKL